MTSLLRRIWPLFVALSCLCSAPRTTHAQPAATGTISGRVFNPLSREYVGNAEVRLEGTNQVTYTESDGSFQFRNVPPGQATVNVSFIGYNPAKDTFQVTAGETAAREISLFSSVSAMPSMGEVVRLEAFTVSSEREGNSACAGRFECGLKRGLPRSAGGGPRHNT